MLGTVEVEVAVGAVGNVGGVTYQIAAETVAHPYAQVVAPRVGE